MHKKSTIRKNLGKEVRIEDIKDMKDMTLEGK